MAVTRINRIGQMMVAKMKIIKTYILSSVLFCGFGLAEVMNTTPPDVTSFIDNADNCSHLSGEWDSSLSKERQKEIEVNLDKYCNLAKEQQKELRKKYKGNKDIENEISSFEF